MLNGNAGQGALSSVKDARVCKRDFEADIARVKADLEVSTKLEDALEKYWAFKGRPYGKEGEPVLAFYGELCLEVLNLGTKITSLILQQEKAELEK